MNTETNFPAPTVGQQRLVRLRIAPKWKRILKWSMMVWRHYRICGKWKPSIEFANICVRFRVHND